MQLSNLPEQLQNEVKETLTGFPRAFVVRENGKFYQIAGLCIDTTEKALDYEVFEFKNTDVFTDEEIEANTKALNFSCF